jgi:hypothetical protein
VQLSRENCSVCETKKQPSEAAKASEAALYPTPEGRGFYALIYKSKFDDQLRLVGKSSADIVLEYSRLVTLVAPSPIPAGVVRDAKDEIILAVAVGGKTDAIVTGDKDLTDLKEYNGISILTPTQFLTMLFSPSDESTDETTIE